MIPECHLTIIWRKDCRIMGMRPTMVTGKAEPMGDVQSYTLKKSIRKVGGGLKAFPGFSMDIVFYFLFSSVQLNYKK